MTFTGLGEPPSTLPSFNAIHVFIYPLQHYLICVCTYMCVLNFGAEDGMRKDLWWANQSEGQVVEWQEVWCGEDE